MRHTWKKWVGCLLAAIMLCTSVDHTALATEPEEAEEGVIEVNENAEEVSVEDASVEGVSEGDVFIGEDFIEHFQADEEDALALMEASGATATSGMLGTNHGITWTYDKSCKTLTVTGEDELCGSEADSPFSGICRDNDVEKIVFQNCKLSGKANSLFEGLDKIKDIDLNGLDTSNVTDMKNMFRECRSLAELDASKFDTSNVTEMQDMFYSCKALKSLNVSSFNTSKVTNMGGMFNGCNALQSLDLHNFDTSNVTFMDGMFQWCMALNSLNLSSFNTSKVTGIRFMFANCFGLTSLDVSNFDTSHATSAYFMFSGCVKLTSLDVSGFDTSQMTNMSSMFGACNSLTSINVSKFDTSKVTDMSGMFSNCFRLKSLDLSNFDMRKVKDVSDMLYLGSSIAILKTPKKMGDIIVGLPETFCDDKGNKYTALDGSNTGKVLMNLENPIYYTIKFDGNGATGGSVSATKRVSYGESVTLPLNKFTRPGYGFMGWNTAADGSGMQYSNCAVVQELTDVNGGTVVLYAQWKEGCYSIAYHISDGSNNPDNPDSYDEDTPTIILKAPTRPGYTFVAWYSDSKLKKKANEIPQGSKGDIIFYAKWKANNYNVSFDGNGATRGKMSELKNRSYGKSFKLGANNFKKSGYTFCGWNTAADGSGTLYKNKASVKNLSTEAGGTAILYAQWESVKYKITYKLGGGSNAGGNPLSYNALTPTITLMEPSKTGYTFDGWYSDSKYRKAVTDIPQGSKGNKTLYAKWTANKYTVKFDGNGATSGEMAELADRVYGKSYTLKKNPFKKDGAVFKGWTLMQDGSGKLYKNKAKIKNLTAEAGGTVTLYAQWK